MTAVTRPVVFGSVLAAVFWLATAPPLGAQWLNEPTLSIPRLADGSPDLAAPAPRTADGRPDLSGTWRMPLPTGYGTNITTDLRPDEIRPWAAALSQQRMEEFGKDDPNTIGCLPGGPRVVLNGGLTRIVQAPDLLVMFYENLTYRQIFLDGRALPTDPHPAFMGYSVGHWEDDTLVVESTGFNTRTWLDFAGHPFSSRLRMTERLRRTDFGNLTIEITVDDPETFTRPFTISKSGRFAADTDLLEYVCLENNRERDGHVGLVGRTEQETVTVAPEILARYVGTWDVVASSNGELTARRFDVRLVDDQLEIDIDGAGRLPMIPMSETTFSPRMLGTYEFQVNGAGEATALIVHSAENVLEARRRQ